MTDKRKKRITCLTVILVIIILLLISLIYNIKHNPGFNALYRRFFGDQMVSGELTLLDSGVTYRTATYQDTVAITSGGEMMFVDINGNKTGDHPILSMSNPMLSVAGKYLIVADAEGKNAVVFENQKQTHTVTCEGTIFFARINSNGYFLTASEEKGYKALVTVYNPSGQEIYRWHSGDRNVLDADVDYDGKSFKVAVLDTDSGVATGRILFFDTSSPTPVHEVVSDTNLFCKINCNRDHSLTTLGDRAITMFGPNSAEMWSIDFGNKPVIAADISSMDRLIVVLSADENAGLHSDRSDMYVYNRDGVQKNSIRFEGQLDSFSVYDDTAVSILNREIAVTDVYSTGSIFLTPNRDLRSITVFDNEKRVLAVSAAGYEILNIR